MEKEPIPVIFHVVVYFQSVKKEFQEKLQKLDIFKGISCTVVDTNSFVDSVGDDNEAWQTFMEIDVANFISKERQKGTQFVFIVGIVDSKHHKGREFYIRNADYKLFLTFTEKQLVQLYYRNVSRLLDNKASAVDSVVNGKFEIVSSTELLDSYNALEIRHIKAGYIEVSLEKSLKHINAIVLFRHSAIKQ